MRPSLLILGMPTGGDTTSTLVSTLMYLSFILFIFFGQKIQLWTMIWNMSGALKKLEYMKTEAKTLTVKTLKDIGKPKDDPTPRLNTLLEHFFISPVDMDPAGVVWKLDHLMDVRDTKFKDDVKRLAPEADEPQVNNLENLVEGSLALNTIFRVVRHFYLLGKKTQSFYLILQLQMILPLVMQEAEALVSATKAFAQGQPIGDGLGPLVASKLMKDSEKRKIEKDVVASELTFEGRNLVVLKAEGPGGNVGKPGDAIRQLIEERKGKVAMVVMVDAAVKFEGEKTGDISEGTGAAIGGVGTERFKIEEEASKFKIPVHALIVKESLQEAIMPMKKEIAESADNVVAKIKSLIQERTKEADTVIVAGIGNTIGVGQ